MGNVNAASAPSGFSSNSGASPPSPPLTAPPPASAGTANTIIPTLEVGNPGTFEELHKKCKGELSEIMTDVQTVQNSIKCIDFTVFGAWKLTSVI